MEPFIDAYAVLGVPEDADQATIKQAHRRLAWRHHPDRAPVEQRATATRRIQEVNLAYGLVRTPTDRARYDQLRQARTQAVTFREASPAAKGGPGAVVGGWALQWDEAMRQAGWWAGRWWRRNEAPLRRAAERAAKRARRTSLRVSSSVTTFVYTWFGVTLAVGAQQLLQSPGLLPPLVGGLGGAIAGTVQGRGRMRALEGHPPMRRPWTPVALWLLALALTLALEATS